MKYLNCKTLAGIICLSLIGCSQPGGNSTRTGADDLQRAQSVALPSSDARTVDDFDTTTQAARDLASTQFSEGGHQIGRTIASLGNPGIPGFWLETPLVNEPVEGRVFYPATDTSVSVRLIPIEGVETAGSRISLAAIRLLGVALDGLVELVVFSD